MEALPRGLLLVYVTGFVHCDVTTVSIPNMTAECTQNDMQSKVNCIISRIEKSNEESKGNKPIRLQIKQTFNWHPRKRIRKECRGIPREEWNQLTDAINTLKKDKSLHPNVYDNFANYHTGGTVPSVHFGPNFFGWHRYYILKFEELLRKVNPNVTLCYWDSRLDSAMMYPKSSIWFSEEFMGNMKGRVDKGPFAHWKTIDNKRLWRHIGKIGKLMTFTDTWRILNKKHHSQITHPIADRGTNVEIIHNYVHQFIGGQMNNLYTSSQDPFFWFHHAFIDSLWEKFRQTLIQRGIDPQDDYVILKNNHHTPNKVMVHFHPMKNIDGYSDYFTKNIYEYDEYAKCPDCLGSPYLKCKKTENKCRSVRKSERRRKVKKMYYNVDKNHLSQPQWDIQILNSSSKIDSLVFVPIKIVFQNAIRKFTKMRNDTHCKNAGFQLDDCSASVALVQSNGINNELFQNVIISDVSIPHIIYAYVAVKNPELGSSRAFIHVMDMTRKLCIPHCRSQHSSKFKLCDGFISVTTKEPKRYFDTIADAEVKGLAFDPLLSNLKDTNTVIKFFCY